MRIIPDHRVVAYYGAPGGAALGRLGAGTPEQAAAAVTRTAAGYRGFGKPVLPAMELIATVAQGSPGPDGDWSEPVPNSAIAAYLRAAHAHGMLLILDIQPGHGDFLSQVKRLRPFLLDPSVGVALDPEWHLGPGQIPGVAIGSVRAAAVNAVAAYVSGLVRDADLPDKLFVIHEFTATMLPDRARIRPYPGLETVFHADGFGTVPTKRNVFHGLAFPGRPFGIGFKLFFTEDARLMTPREAMSLRPQPDVVTYQ